MKAIIFSLSLLILPGQLLRAQDNLPKKHIIYKARISFINSASTTGYLNYITDSTLLLSEYPLAVQLSFSGENKLQTFHYTDLQKIQLRRKGSIGRGILYGSLIGLATGFIAGFAQGDDPVVPADQDFLGLRNAFRTTAFEKGLAGGTIGALGGSIVGGIIGGLAHKKFIINGKKEKFTEMRLSVLERIYSQNTNSQ